MTDTLKQVSILVPGKLNPHALERTRDHFHAIEIAAGDAKLITPEMAEKVRGIASSTIIDAALIDALPKLEIIANFGVGYDSVDAVYAASRGVMVTNTPDVLTDEVADTTIGLILNTLREFPKAETYLRAGRWEREGSYPLTPMTLRGRRAGIFGLGRIGKAIARRLEAFDVPVSYHGRTRQADVAYPYQETLAALAEAVDLLIVAAPGGNATYHAVDAAVLKALGPDGVLINIGRGPVVDEAALIAALRDGTIRAAGLDVFENEPHVPQALLELDNACLLPHVASASVATRERMADLVVDNLAAWFSGKPALTPVAETLALQRGTDGSEVRAG